MPEPTRRLSDIESKAVDRWTRLFDAVAVRRIAPVLLLVLVVWTGVGPAWYTSFSVFATWDDDGYLLSSTREFLDYGGLYESTFSHYGPFYFVYKWFLHSVAGVPVTHEGVRWQTLSEWCLTAAGLSFLTWKLTRSGILVALSALHSLCTLVLMPTSAGHPQGVLLLLLTAALCASSYVSAQAPRWPLLLMGACCGAAAMTKVNVGAFLACGLGLAICWNTPRAALWSSVARLAIGAACLVLPLALLRGQLESGWCQRYWLVVTSSALAVVLISARLRPAADGVSGHQCSMLVVALLAVVGLAGAFALVTGTSLYGLVDGVLLRPARHPGSFTIPLTLPSITYWTSGVSLAVAVVAAHGSSSLWSARLLIGAKALAALAILGTWSRGSVLLGVGLPFAWLVLVPVSNGRDRPCDAPLPRAALAAMTVLHALVAYPVAGAQRDLATLLLGPLGAVLLADALRSFRTDSRVTWPGRRAVRAAELALVTLAVIVGLTQLHRLRLPGPARYDSGWPLQLAGAQDIRLPLEQAAALGWVAANLEAHADTFVGDPGVDSFYPWSSLRPPTGFNVTNWMVSLTDAEQARIVTSIQTHDWPMVVQLRPNKWLDSGPAAGGPLLRLIGGEFVPWRACLQDRRTAWISSQAAAGIASSEEEPKYVLCLPATRQSDDMDQFVLLGSSEFGGEGQVRAFPWWLVLHDAKAVSLELRFRARGPGILAALTEGPARPHPSRSMAIARIDAEGRVLTQITERTSTPLRGRDGLMDGEWHHLVAVTDGTMESLYLDGELVGSIPAGPLPKYAAGTLGLGWLETAGTGETVATPHQGGLQDVVLHERALSSAEVRLRAARSASIRAAERSRGR